jgi:stearoyl-CoA desaturase (delta-9 desaturase)
MTEQQTMTPLAAQLQKLAQPAPQATYKKKSSWRISSLLRSATCWFDTTTKSYSEAETDDKYSIDWLRMIPYAGMHFMCFGVIWVGWSPIAVIVAAALYAIHMFAITAFYHRYFSHRTFKTSRVAQFIFALVGASCVQRGAIWWAARHRHHHRHSDEEDDIHSPHRHGFYWSHVGWITSKAGFDYDAKAVPDLMKFPELRFLNRFDNLVPLIEAVMLFFFGMFLEAYGWNTSGFQMLIWGFFVSTIISSHATFTINSLTHMWGTKRYKSKDESRNSLLLALLTFGEGWHNNHHYYPGAVRQGFYWWEIDLTYYGLCLLARLGIIWDLTPIPRNVRESHQL